MSAAALEALRKELPRGTTVGQNRRTYRGPVAVGDEDSVLSQGDPPSGVKKHGTSPGTFILTSASSDVIFLASVGITVGPSSFLQNHV